ncbi:hypothetical protein DL89DRAFT_270494 [Linderina pennispora]|uniref:Uncharacterized protein n=1 Tax=Linderina pennispora TaxID=61395 RepID=A0A1Y1VXD6_9FUNG|nr:uncharacterized protein DL89DRAFT_270494 [Linderina pennispora]ORX65942.1 hypothetical protein DL89DRAFT_270494 [Linderina pennispora]
MLLQNVRSYAAKKPSPEIAELTRSLQRKQLVLDHFDIPGKYQKFFTGRLRKRETRRMERQLEDNKQTAAGDLKRVSAKSDSFDEEVQTRRQLALRKHILRILGAPPLSLLYWEITDVIVSFNLKSVVCCYKITASTKDEGIKPYQMRKIVDESTEYLNAVCGSGSGTGTPTAKLLEQIESHVGSAPEPEPPADQQK